MKTIRCIVACWNWDGEPDLYFVKVEESENYRDKAVEEARRNGYAEEGPVLVYDEFDSAGKAMLPLFDWETASIVS